MFLKNTQNAFNGLSILEKFVRTRVFLFIVPSMTPLVCTHALEVFPVSCYLDDSVISHNIVFMRNESIRFETYLL